LVPWGVRGLYEVSSNFGAFLFFLVYHTSVRFLLWCFPFFHLLHPSATVCRQEGAIGPGSDVGVGWVLAARLGKRGTFPPHPRGGTGLFPTRGSQRTRPARHFAPPPGEGPRYGSGDYPPPGQGCVCGGVSDHPRKVGFSLAKCFFAHLSILALFFSFLFSEPPPRGGTGFSN